MNQRQSNGEPPADESANTNPAWTAQKTKKATEQQSIREYIGEKTIIRQIQNRH